MAERSPYTRLTMVRFHVRPHNNSSRLTTAAVVMLYIESNQYKNKAACMGALLCMPSFVSPAVTCHTFSMTRSSSGHPPLKIPTELSESINPRSILHRMRASKSHVVAGA